MTNRSTSRSDPPGQHWQAHPAGAALLRAGAVLIPLVSGYVGASIAAGSIDQPVTNPGRWLWWIGIAGVALVVTWSVGRLSARLVPLAGLMDLDLTFPEAAPTRSSIIERAGDLVELRRMTSHASITGGQDPGSHAASALAIMTALDRHDPRHRGHSGRTTAIADLMAQQMGLTPPDRQKLRWATLLHDIGKLGLPDDVLRGSSDGDQVFRGHAPRSARIAAPLGSWLGHWVETIEHHHEAWNGTGYPSGLEGEQIPLGARIVAVADTLDRLSNDPKTPMGIAQARRAISNQAGGRFDPEVVRALVRVPLRRLQRIRGPLVGWLPARVGMVLSRSTSLIVLATAFLFTFVAGASGSLLPIPDLRSFDLGGLISFNRPVVTTLVPPATTQTSGGPTTIATAVGSTTTSLTPESTVTTRPPRGTTTSSTTSIASTTTSTTTTAPSTTTAATTTTTTTPQGTTTTAAPTTTTTAPTTTTTAPTTTTTAAATTTSAAPTTTTAGP